MIVNFKKIVKDILLKENFFYDFLKYWIYLFIIFKWKIYSFDCFWWFLGCCWGGFGILDYLGFIWCILE